MRKKTIKFNCTGVGPGGFRAGEIQSRPAKEVDWFVKNGYGVEVKKEQKATTRSKRIVKPEEES